MKNPAYVLCELMKKWNIETKQTDPWDTTIDESVVNVRDPNSPFESFNKERFITEFCVNVSRLIDALEKIPNSENDIELANDLLPEFLPKIVKGEYFVFSKWTLTVVAGMRKRIDSSQPVIPSISEETLIGLRRSFEEILACSGELPEQFRYFGDTLRDYAKRGLDLALDATPDTVDLAALQSVTFALTGTFTTLMSVMLTQGVTAEEESKFKGCS